jgi:hypothetical protein
MAWPTLNLVVPAAVAVAPMTASTIIIPPAAVIITRLPLTGGCTAKRRETGPSREECCQSHDRLPP